MRRTCSAKDATLEIAGHGLFEGQDRIRTYLHALGKLEYRALLNHIPLQPAIRIAPDGNSAQASWRTFMQAVPWKKKRAGAKPPTKTSM